MTTQKKTKYVHEGKYMAEVDVELIVNENEWSPYLTLEDAYKLDDVRKALMRGDLKTAAKNARIYELHRLVIGGIGQQQAASADGNSDALHCR